ncbi:MAG: hypothetical protein ABI123_08215 [Ginsengibacter sp.]|jgi:hypothetical protein
MDPKTTFILITVISALVIVTGLGVTIAGVVRKKKAWIALGVGIAMIPTIISWIYGLLK